MATLTNLGLFMAMYNASREQMCVCISLIWRSTLLPSRSECTNCESAHVLVTACKSFRLFRDSLARYTTMHCETMFDGSEF